MADVLSAYTTLDYKSRLDILEGGKVAIFSRSQTLRVQNIRSCFIDRVWGDGVLMAEYTTRGLELFESVRDTKGYTLLLGYPKSLALGDVVRIETRRKIVGAFHDPESFWELAMPAPTQRFTFELATPAGLPIRLPHISAPSFEGVDATEEKRLIRIQVTNPELYVPYRLDWSW